MSFCLAKARIVTAPRAGPHGNTPADRAYVSPRRRSCSSALRPAAELRARRSSGIATSPLADPMRSFGNPHHHSDGGVSDSEDHARDERWQRIWPTWRSARHRPATRLLQPDRTRSAGLSDERGGDQKLGRGGHAFCTKANANTGPQISRKRSARRCEDDAFKQEILKMPQ